VNINDLTIGEVKEIAKTLGFGTNNSIPPQTKYPRFDGLVVAQFIGRFVFVCNLEIKEGFCYLTNVRNVRYWEARTEGLGDLANNGASSGDKIDDWPDQVIPFDKLGPVMTAGGWK